jgi:hypothetical protein
MGNNGWESGERHTKKHGQEVKAVLTFNDGGMLENFVSGDRSKIDDKGNMGNIPYEFLR